MALVCFVVGSKVGVLATWPFTWARGFAVSRAQGRDRTSHHATYAI